MNEAVKNVVPVGITARHVHLSREHLDILFGKDYELTPIKYISQPGQYASKELVHLVTAKDVIKNVRVLGPVRKQTQVELAKTDALKLGVNPPLRNSGDLAGSLGGVTLVGPKGVVTLTEGVIVVIRHIHMTPKQAEEYGGLQDKQIVKVRCNGERGLIFDNVLMRVTETAGLDFHLDTDEANAAGLKTGDTVEIIG